MVLREIRQILEAWAPPDIAWEHDNIGLQVGSLSTNVRTILVALDVTDEVVKEAQEKNIDLIVSHHPLLFHPLHSVNTSDRIGRLAASLLKNRIAVYSAHTNLDFTQGGVSVALAKALLLRDIGILQKNQRVLKKISVFVPGKHVDAVTEAMASAGAGRIGNYDWCSFRAEGLGTYMPNSRARPYQGHSGRLERAVETRLEMTVSAWNLQTVVDAMIAAHPYEEVAYDVYDLVNASQSHGAGAIGTLSTALSLEKFLTHVRQRLHAPAIRYAGKSGRKIRRVAVCGGSGSDLLPVAIEQRADAFVTADVRFHKFHEADGQLVLIDAGHFETECHVVPEIVNYLKDQFALRKEKMKVMASRSSRNVVQYSFS